LSDRPGLARGRSLGRGRAKRPAKRKDEESDAGEKKRPTDRKGEYTDPLREERGIERGRERRLGDPQVPGLILHRLARRVLGG
jgi:hypothetical protein